MRITNTLLRPLLCVILVIVVGLSLSNAAVQTQKEEVIDIFFVDRQHGWLLTSGDHTRGFRTVNGGDSWSEIETRDGTYKLYFLDSLSGWALAVDTHNPKRNIYSLFRTLDGGLHWTQTPMDIPGKLQPVLINDFLFVDPQRGWFVGHGSFGGAAFSTVDGGKTWQEVNTVSRREGLTRMTALDKDRVWIFGKNTIVATADGGNTWLMELHGGRKVTDEILLDGGVILPDGNGWAAGESHGPVILHTSNFGKTWQRSFKPPEWGWIHDISFTDADHGCTIGASTALYCTADGGKSWEKRYVPGVNRDLQASYAMMRILLTDKNHGWLIAQDGLLFRSNDGGRSWSAVALPPETSH